jgi:hypothetical protein
MEDGGVCSASFVSRRSALSSCERFKMMAAVDVAPAKGGKKKTGKRLLFATAAVLLLMTACVNCYDDRKSGHQQSSGAATVRTLVSSEIQYKSTYGHYTLDIKALSGNAEQCQKPTSTHACLVDEVVANSSAASPKAAYYFTVNLGSSADTFMVWGIPVEPDYRVFCATEDEMVRMSAADSNISSTSYAACKSLTPIGD